MRIDVSITKSPLVEFSQSESFLDSVSSDFHARNSKDFRVISKLLCTYFRQYPTLF